MNYATPPREIIKWLQTLELSFPIKNYKRDFANGYLLADILSKYYPLDVQMHSYDTGNGTGAKKNNWNLLERIFVKFNIPITKDLINQVAQSTQPKATTIVLTIIYGHLNKKILSSTVDSSVIVTSLNTMPTKQTTFSLATFNEDSDSSGLKSPALNSHEKMAFYEETHSKKQNNNQQDGLMTINQVSNQKHNQTGDSSLTIKEEGSLTGLQCTKTLFSLFLPLPPQISFARSVYQPAVAREVLGTGFEKRPDLFCPDSIATNLQEKRQFILDCLRTGSNITSDFQSVCETFLPILFLYPVSSALFKSVADTLCFYGNVCQQVWGGCEAYRRFSSTRDFTSTIRLVSLKSMDKIPFVANLVHAFLGPGTADAECIRIFLDLKNMICESSSTLLGGSGGNQGGNASGNQSSSSSEYLFFFAAFNAIDHHPIHSATNQLTVFHLSECLTIINSYKSPLQRRSLLVATEEEKNASSSVISSAEIPSLEVSAMLHILSSILRCRVSLRRLKILSDVVCSALRIFFKIVIHPACPSNIRKAYLQVLLQLDGSGEAAELGLQDNVFSALVLVLRKFKGETLKDVLYMVAPVLSSHSNLSTSFTLALLSVPTLERNKMLDPLYTHNLSWDLPFMFDPECSSLTATWDVFSVIMGMLRMTQLDKGPLSQNSLELLQICLHSPDLSKPCLDTLFTKFHEYLFAGLGVEETSQSSWDVILIFILKASKTPILKKFHTLLACLLYTQTLEQTKCKRRLMGRLRKLASLDVGNLEQCDRYYILKDMPVSDLKDYQLEADRILRLFKHEFPVLSSQKLLSSANFADWPLPLNHSTQQR